MIAIDECQKNETPRNSKIAIDKFSTANLRNNDSIIKPKHKIFQLNMILILPPPPHFAMYG